MSVSHELRYYHPDGTYANITAFSGIKCAYGLGVVGELVVTLPLREWDDATFFTRLGTAEFWRSVDGVPYLEGDRLWRLQYIRDKEDIDRRRTAELRFVDDTHLIDGREILYASGTPQARKDGYIDNIMKEIVRENAGTLAVDRDLSEYLTIAEDVSGAPEGHWSGAWQPVLQELVELGRLSANKGVPLFFDCVRISPTQSRFTTFINHRGVSFGTGSAQPRLLNIAGGMITEPEFVQDWRDERNFITVVGGGEGEDRITRSYPAVSPSPILRRELVRDARHIDPENTDALEELAESTYWANISSPVFTAKIRETEEFRYGRDCHYGDVFVADYRGWTGDVHIRAVKIVVDDLDYETVTLGISNYE